MHEFSTNEYLPEPKILVIGIGGGGNNAVDRMIDTKSENVDYAAMNTDIQTLHSCKADIKIQLGKKLTSGFGAGSDSDIGEAAAKENEEEIKELVKDYDLCILTCGMGGGTGTGAISVIANCCKAQNILTIAIVTTPFSYEGTPRLLAAQNGLEKLKSNVDTLLIIPNDKLIGLSDTPLFLEDAFQIADSVLKYSIEGITNIIYNRGMVNLDFNDLRTTLSNKGIGHLGIGIVDTGTSILEAVDQAINSPLLDTTILGASNLLINTCGKINITELNDAINYVRKIAGEHVNIIWGTVTATNFDTEKISVTLIATGMTEKKPEPSLTKATISEKHPELELKEWKLNTKTLPTSSPKIDLVIPSFLLDAHRRK